MKRAATGFMGCIVCTVALGQSSPNRGRGDANDERPSFEKLDKDHDSKVSQDEARANTQVAARFAGADKNGDGFLSRAEFQAQFNRQDE